MDESPETRKTYRFVLLPSPTFFAVALADAVVIVIVPLIPLIEAVPVAVELISAVELAAASDASTVNAIANAAVPNALWQ